MTTDTTDSTSDAKSFDAWAVVHLFGRHTVAGRASEQKIAGQDFLRVDIPEVDCRQARTVLYHPNAVYDIEPVDEETARLVAQTHQPAAPVHEWSARRALAQGASQLALGTPDPDEEGDEGGDAWDDEAPI